MSDDKTLKGPILTDVATSRQRPAAVIPTQVLGSATGSGPLAFADTLAHPDGVLRAGQMVGEYRVTGCLGSGGMGTVYAGVQPLIGKPVAIKVLAPQFLSKPDIIARFIQEARAVNQINSRYIVDIFSYGTMADGHVYFVMELLQGRSLADVLQTERRLRYGKGIQILECICRGLSAAHEKEIIHRDLKPENIMVLDDPDGTTMAKILDFGIAKLLDDESPRKTNVGLAIGTPHYMAPEQIRTEAVDQRTDIYALGIMMYEMFVGQLPFRAKSEIEIFNLHLGEPAPDPRAQIADFPESLATLILACLAKDPEYRPGSVDEIIKMLRAPELMQIADAVPAPILPERRITTPAPAPVTSRVMQRRSGKTWIIPLALVAVAAVGVTAWIIHQRGSAKPVRTVVPRAVQPVVAKPEPKPPAPVPVPPAAIDIATKPSGAFVTIDGTPVEQATPTQLSKPAGTYQIRVTAAGYEPHEDTVTVADGEHLKLSYVLVEQPPPVVAPPKVVSRRRKRPVPASPTTKDKPTSQPADQVDMDDTLRPSFSN